ncbi:MAG: hypothetical protein WCP55_23330, partial [Lentisphaerota bacterium]
MNTPETSKLFKKWRHPISGVESFILNPDSIPFVQSFCFVNTRAKTRRPHRISTHLTFSADRKSVSLDAQIGNEWFVGAMSLNGRPPEIWQKITDCCANHAQLRARLKITWAFDGRYRRL